MLSCRYLIATILFGLTLSACGGGAGGPAANAPTAPPAAPPSPPPVSNFLPGPRPVAEPQSFVSFESGHVRPLALSADARFLFAVNTPDNRLEIFTTSGDLSHFASVSVGMEPVAVSVAPDGTIWVVNHLSDSVSVVDVNSAIPQVVQTLWVGDEPRDIVFAGQNRERAFITTAHRGQNSPVDPQLNTGSVGRADVWVFDSTALDDLPGGSVESVITLFGDRPRPLAVSADGLRVFVGVFLSGNQTTAIAPFGHTKGAPTTSADGVQQPDSGSILKFSSGNWIDADGNVHSNHVPFTLPDYDVFELDATTLTETRRISGVGTVLFNMITNPVTNELYVSNLNSNNHVRFSGDGSRGGTTVRGHLTDQQISILDNGQNVRVRNLNKHLDFAAQTGSQADRDRSLSTLLGMAISQDGETLYVSAFGSGRIGVFKTAELADDSFVPDAQNQVALSGGGPS